VDRNPCYFGRGRVHFGAPLTYAGEVNATAYGAGWGANWGDFPAPAGTLRMPPGRFMGNAKDLMLRPLLDAANVPQWAAPDHQGAGDIVQGVEGTLTLYGHGARNLVDVLRGALAQQTGGAHTQTVATSGASIEADAMLFTDTAIDLTQPVTVAPTWATWTEGVHWVAGPFGIRLLQGFAGPVGSSIMLAYTTDGGGSVIEALAQPVVETSLVYVGVNRHDEKPVRCDAYRVRMNLTEGVGFITEATGELRLALQLQPVLPAGAERLRWHRIFQGDTPNG
jgi:hypothetical protein